MYFYCTVLLKVSINITISNINLVYVTIDFLIGLFDNNINYSITALIDDIDNSLSETRHGNHYCMMPKLHRFHIAFNRFGCNQNV